MSLLSTSITSKNVLIIVVPYAFPFVQFPCFIYSVATSLIVTYYFPLVCFLVYWGSKSISFFTGWIFCNIDTHSPLIFLHLSWVCQPFSFPLSSLGIRP